MRGHRVLLCGIAACCVGVGVAAVRKYQGRLEAQPSPITTTTSSSSSSSSSLSSSSLLFADTVSQAKKCQSGICSGATQYAAHIRITFSEDANLRLTPKLAESIGKEEGVVETAIGFDPAFVHRIGLETSKGFKSEYHTLAPQRSGDIFILAKSNSLRNLVVFAKQFYSQFPHGYIELIEDDYGFSSKSGTDLTGVKLCDSKMSPNECLQKTVSVDGSTYMLTQKWRHNWPLVDHVAPTDLDEAIGRSRDGKDLTPADPRSHLSRVKTLHPTSPISRTTYSFGSVHRGSGVLFSAHGKSSEVLNSYLTQLFQIDEISKPDPLLEYNQCVDSHIW